MTAVLASVIQLSIELYRKLMHNQEIPTEYFPIQIFILPQEAQEVELLDLLQIRFLTQKMLLLAVAVAVASVAWVAVATADLQRLRLDQQLR